MRFPILRLVDSYPIYSDEDQSISHRSIENVKFYLNR